VQKLDGSPAEQRYDGHRSDEATPARTRAGERKGSLRVQSSGPIGHAPRDGH
jgi:hypothetical protein